MSKKTIVLADNSYTIRRIVELSFSEEKDIELKSFENSLNLREKLLELRPQVVMVDIKLPEFNGYQVCKFIQESESLRHTKVFLLKGGFEPIDENMLKNLRYVDIITKPFDSNALVSNVKKLIDEMPAPAAVLSEPPPQMDLDMDMPSSLPEETPEIDTLPESEGDISFSDIKDEIDSDSILGSDEFSGSPAPYPYSDDDILPSEEITQAQGTGPDRDSLATHVADEIDNPFDDDLGLDAGAYDSDSLKEEELNIKRNIEFQEKELEIGSLTMEEIEINQDIERQRHSNHKQQSLGLDDDLDGLDDLNMGIPDMEPEMGDDLPMDFGSNMHLRDVPEFDEEELDEDSESSDEAVAEPDTSELFPDVNMESIDSMIGRPHASPATGPELDEVEAVFWTENKKTPQAMDEDIFGAEPQKAISFASVDSFGDADEKLFADDADMPDVNYQTDYGHGASVHEEEVKSHPKKTDQDVIESFPSGKPDIADLEIGDYEADTAADEENEYVVPDMGLESPATIKWDGFQEEEETPPPSIEEFPGFDSLDLPRLEDLPGVDVPQAPRVPLVPQAPEVTPSVQVTRTPPVAPPVQVPHTPPVVPPVPVPHTPPVTPIVQVPRTPPVVPSVHEPKRPPVVPIMQEPKVTPVVEPVKTAFIPPAPSVIRQAPEAPVAPPVAPVTTGVIPHEEILRKIEDKLTHAIKEMLWEIVPPLAEKIIKAEIATLKAETEKSLK